MGLINKYNSHNAANFTNTITPSEVNWRVLDQPLNSIEAVMGKINGGKKNNARIIYKRKGEMKTKTKKHILKNIKRRTRCIKKCLMRKNKSNKKTNKSNLKKKNIKSVKRRGGYSQYQSNLPLTQTYATGGPLAPTESALANPVPYKVLSNCTNCVDNYDLYSNSGFPSKGWY